MTRRDSPEYEAHRAARQLGTVDDPVVVAARSTVQLARQRLEHVRRAFMFREAGRTDVAAAEAALSRALDQLDTAHNGQAWR